jgi:hypothetical protein
MFRWLIRCIPPLLEVVCTCCCYDERLPTVLVADANPPAGYEAAQFERTRVPRHTIAFSDRPYTTDMHLPNAFRHPMMIPDDIFPEAWRNAKHQNSTTASATSTSSSAT